MLIFLPNQLISFSIRSVKFAWTLACFLWRFTISDLKSIPSSYSWQAVIGDRAEVIQGLANFLLTKQAQISFYFFRLILSFFFLGWSLGSISTLFYSLHSSGVVYDPKVAFPSVLDCSIVCFSFSLISLAGFYSFASLRLLRCNLALKSCLQNSFCFQQVFCLLSLCSMNLARTFLMNSLWFFMNFSSSSNSLLYLFISLSIFFLLTLQKIPSMFSQSFGVGNLEKETIFSYGLLVSESEFLDWQSIILLKVFRQLMGSRFLKLNLASEEWLIDNKNIANTQQTNRVIRGNADQRSRVLMQMWEEDKGVIIGLEGRIALGT